MNDSTTNRPWQQRACVFAIALLMLGLLSPHSVCAQDPFAPAPRQTDKPAATPTAGQDSVPDGKSGQPKQEGELAPPENLVLDTKDGVSLRCTYFAPAESADEAGSNVVPIILLHDWNGDRKQLLEFGEFLQNKGHAVIAPDLRGHGQSLRVAGSDELIDASDFKKPQVFSARRDIERCKKYLVQRHNDGDVNIDLLSLLAVGETGVLAVQWTLSDWFDFPAYNTDGIKQGQDVKSIVLISPTKKLSGVSILPSLKHPLFTGSNGAAIPMLILWSATDESVKDSQSIFNSLQKARPDPSKIEDRDERASKTTLFSVPVNKSRFSGVELMETQRVKGLWEYIEDTMFTRKVKSNADRFPWKTRKAEPVDE